VLIKLGQVLELVGEWSEATDLYRQALRLAEQTDNRHAVASCRRAIGWLLRKQGEYGEATSWLIQALEEFERLGDYAAVTGSSGVSQVMTEIGEIKRQLGAYGEAKKWYEDALSLARSVQDDPECPAGRPVPPVPEDREPRLMAQAQALKGAGTLAAQQGDNATARALYEESLEIRRELGDRPGVAALLSNLGVVAYYSGDYAAAQALDEESLTVFREIGDRWSAGTLLNNLGDIVRDQGDYEAARQLLEESLGVRRQLGDMGGIAFSLNSLGDVLLDEGDHASARPVLVESLTINRELGDRAAMAYLLDDFAILAAAEGQPERALRLAGAAAATRDAIGSQLSAGERARFDRLQAPARAQLAEPLAAAVYGEGLAMTLEQAVEEALGVRN
jgi:tetratricopeptide (TPR) repeat protein